MAEHLKDADDRWLESMFAAEAIADGGFSARVVRKIRNRQRFRALCLLAAIFLGGVIALKPALALASLSMQLLREVSGSLAGILPASIPSATMLVGGTLLFAIAAIAMRFLED